jgi:hypothetical protein
LVARQVCRVEFGQGIEHTRGANQQPKRHGPLSRPPPLRTNHGELKSLGRA